MLRSAPSLISGKLAIVGAGPAGIYAARYALKNLPGLRLIDIWEKDLCPLGQLRLGVSADHPSLKEVLASRFIDTLRQEDRIHFFTGYEVTSADELESYYENVIIATGSHQNPRTRQELIEQHRVSVIDDDHSVTLVGAESFNGALYGWTKLPRYFYRALQDHKSYLIIGGGNVSLDIVRFLVSPKERYGAGLISSCREHFEPKVTRLLIRAPWWKIKATNQVLRLFLQFASAVDFEIYNLTPLPEGYPSSRTLDKRKSILNEIQNSECQNPRQRVEIHFETSLSVLEIKRRVAKTHQGQTIPLEGPVVWATGAGTAAKLSGPRSRVVGWAESGGIGALAFAQQSAKEGISALLTEGLWRGSGGGSGMGDGGTDSG